MDFFISDTHFSHDKDFIYKARGFNSIQEHDEATLCRINETVEQDDDLYILGDICLGDSDKTINYLRRIICQNIHIIRGNHDSNKRISLYDSSPNVVEISEGKYYKSGKWVFYLSHYPCMTSNYDDGDKSLQRHRWNICGHTHTADKYLHMNVGAYHVDVDCTNGYPVSIDKIKDDIRHYFGKQL